jgi:hypothetical protein
MHSIAILHDRDLFFFGLGLVYFFAILGNPYAITSNSEQPQA